jgi:hypothetical protein
MLPVKKRRVMLAATNKCLAQSNKSRLGSKATNEAEERRYGSSGQPVRQAVLMSQPTMEQSYDEKEQSYDENNGSLHGCTMRYFRKCGRTLHDV